MKKIILIVIIPLIAMWEGIGILVMGCYIDDEKEQFIVNLKDVDIRWIDNNMISLKYEFITKNLPSIAAKYYWNNVGLIWRWSPATKRIDEIFAKDFIDRLENRSSK